jgi:protein TonB
METNKILTADLLDLIFDDRNKDYGAYELRRTYEKRIKKALLITATIGALGFTGTLLANKLNPDESIVKMTPGIVLTSIDDDPEPEPELPKPKPQAQPAVQVRTEIFTPPVIEPDEIVDKPMVAQDDLANAKIGLIKIDVPDGGGDILLPPEGVDSGTGLIDVQKSKEPEQPWIKVEVDAKYPGDWGRFLENNLRGDEPAGNGAPPGKYTVILQFVVDVEGNVSDIKALTSHGYGMEEEAIRVLKKSRSKKWIPAFQNSRHVPAYRKQPITFVINAE